MNTISRRQFIHLSALAATGVVASACANTAEPTLPAEQGTTPSPPQAEASPTPQAEASPTPQPAPKASEKQAPTLADQVASGALPPVEERLSSEPKAVEVVEEIGQYGGTLRTTNTEPVTPDNVRDIWYQSMFIFSTDCTQVNPNLATAYEWGDEYKTLTVYMRKGVKWSDGEPFTADDVMFYWDDIVGNKDLTPAFPGNWRPGGEAAEFEKLDDYTVRAHFANPYPAAMSKLGHPTQMMQTNFYDPKHYLQNWHVAYNENAAQLAKEEGYENWWEAFQYHRALGPWETDTNIPTTGTWVPTEVTPTIKTLVRNAYFWQTDVEGNQWPYVDQIVGEMVSDLQVMNMKVISGEIDYEGFDLLMEDFAVFKENEEQGDYRVLRWKSIWGSAVSFMANTQHKDPVLREIFGNLQFRRALSLAINRDEINDKIFAGQGTPRQATVLPTVSFYKPEWAENYAQYAPDEANRLLDEMGLDQRDGEGFRLRPDGQTLAVLVEYIPVEGPKGPVCELVRDYWQEVGIKVTLKSEHRALLQERLDANEHDIGVWHTDSCTEMFSQIQPLWWYPGSRWCMYVPEYVRWFTSDGEQGEEPPAEWKELVDTFTKWNALPREGNEDEWDQLGQKIWDFHAENLYVIGTVGMPLQPIVFKNRVRNVPEDGWWGWDNDFWATYHCGQWFIRE